MKLADLHERFCRDASYRRVYADLLPWVALGLHLRAVREICGTSRRKRSAELGLSEVKLTRIERGLERDWRVVKPLVVLSREELEANGFPASEWLLAAEEQERG
jgi:hypothetical protein